jgi:anti-sigma-K factor RskA
VNQRVRDPFEVLAMAHDRGRHPWVRRIAIALALVAGYAVLGALTFQDSPNDPPIIVTLLSK